MGVKVAVARSKEFIIEWYFFSFGKGVLNRICVAGRRGRKRVTLPCVISMAWCGQFWLMVFGFRLGVDVEPNDFNERRRKLQSATSIMIQQVSVDD